MIQRHDRISWAKLSRGQQEVLKLMARAGDWSTAPKPAGQAATALMNLGLLDSRVERVWVEKDGNTQMKNYYRINARGLRVLKEGVP